MNTRILLLIVFVISVSAFFVVSWLGTLERQARVDISRARALPSAFRYNTQSTADGTVVRTAMEMADNGWVPMPVGAPGNPVTDAEIETLPEPAQRYFRYAKVAGKPRISSFSVIMEGKIRNGSTDPRMPLVMRQYNRLDNPARVVFLSSTKPPMKGIDSFIDGNGRMLIKALDLIKVVDFRGPEMDVSALVTFLNDLTLCPVAYFSLPVRWRQSGPDSVELSLTHAGMTVSAVMTVDVKGRPVNWETEDRYAEVKGQHLKDRWSTPFEGEEELAGMIIPEKGVGIHDFDGTPYVYIELDRIHSLALNATDLPRHP
jgi:hypothetical protein